MPYLQTNPCCPTHCHLLSPYFLPPLASLPSAQGLNILYCPGVTSGTWSFFLFQVRTRPSLALGLGCIRAPEDAQWATLGWQRGSAVIAVCNTGSMLIAESHSVTPGLCSFNLWPKLLYDEYRFSVGLYGLDRQQVFPLNQPFDYLCAKKHVHSKHRGFVAETVQRYL